MCVAAWRGGGVSARGRIRATSAIPRPRVPTPVFSLTQACLKQLAALHSAFAVPNAWLGKLTGPNLWSPARRGALLPGRGRKWILQSVLGRHVAASLELQGDP